MAREREEGAHPLLSAYAVLAHAVILIVVFWTIYTSKFSDVPIYYRYASELLAGKIPYRDFAMEYPPGALIFFTLPRLVGHTITQYYAAFRVEIVLTDVLILVALNAIARRRGLHRTAVLGAYTVFVLTVGPIIGQDFDIFPAATVVFALFFFGRGELYGTSLMLGLGIITKLYPALLVPAFAMHQLHQRRYGAIVRSAAAALATMLAVTAPLLLVAPRDVMSFLKYHAARGVHAESTYGSVLVAANRLHDGIARIEYNFGSWNLSGQAAAAIKPLTTIVMLAALAWVYLAMYRATRHDDRDPAADAANWTVLALLAALITSKVLSPQYLIWLMPLVPLVTSSARRTLWIAFAGAGIVTYYIFPVRYMALVGHQDADVVAALVLRNSLLVVMTVVLWRSLTKKDRLT